MLDTVKSFAILEQSHIDEIKANLENRNVVRAYNLPGADAGVKIAAAIAKLNEAPQKAGIVDATGFANPQNLSGFTVSPGITVFLGAVFHTAAGPNPIIVNQGGRLIGLGRNSPGA
jgi:hypothetical protein